MRGDSQDGKLITSSSATSSLRAAAISSAALPEDETTTSGDFAALSIAARATRWVLEGAKSSEDFRFRAG